MAEKENEEDPQVNLEMPSIGFGRKKRRKDTDETEAVAEETTTEERVTPPPPPEEETRPLYVDDVPPDVPATEAPLPEAPLPESKPAPTRPREPLRINIPGIPAALVTGAAVGALTVGLTTLGLLGCEAIQGTESCGGPGFFMLVAIMVLAVVVGSWLFKVFQVIDPGSTSFLAVGLAVVITLLFLIEVIFEWYMFIVMPLVFVATYTLAHWVTVRYIEPADHA